MSTISAFVITFNEEKNIEDCLRSIEWVDEIIVVDSGSTDKTLEIARKYTDRVYFNPWPGYGPQREFASNLAKSDWILSLDADERVSTALRDEILNTLTLAHDNHIGYRVPRIEWMFGIHPHYGSWPHQTHIQLYRRGKAAWKGNIHEYIEISGEIGRLHGALYHFSHSTLDEFIAMVNKYTHLEALEAYRQGRRIGLTFATVRSLRAFVGQYIRLQGFRDGGHGLILAVAMSFYEFMKHAKLWVMWYQHDHPESQRPNWK